VEVQCVQLNYEFGKQMGLRLAVKMTALIVIEHYLTEDLRPRQSINRYYGLTRSQLLKVLRHELPWVDGLPNGAAGEDRQYDRRPPRDVA
jgi:predicted Zn-dependent protease